MGASQEEVAENLNWGGGSYKTYFWVIWI